ncbi:unnamed protein product [Linum tenue]|uniref:BHLH domain-containing protein n=1 Tax=Linum tenue TaxID=586396 RepID=A0AAV0KUH3_9ROSI|nr:unnamed protein product [Linum tenue]
MKSRNSSSTTLVDTPAAALKVAQNNKRGSSSLKNRGKGVVKEGGGEGDQSEQQVHIWTERERRKRMRTMFTNLQALLPQLPSKADKSTIVDEAISYIKTLHQTLQALEKQKLEKLQGLLNLDSEPSAVSVITTSQAATPQLPFAVAADQSWPSKPFPPPSMITTSTPPSGFQTWFSPNVVLNMWGEDAQICICSAKKQGLLATILHILEKHGLDVVSAHISSGHHRCTYMIHAHAGGGSCGQFPESSLSVEDTFKLAAGEMNLWLLSC